MKNLCTYALFVLLAPLPLHAAHKSATGEWWGSASNTARNSFVGGFMDCYVYDAEMGKNGLNMTTEFWAPQITRFYMDHQDEHGLSVASVLEKLILNPRIANAKSHPGETTILEGKHATFDSDLWRTRLPEERLGYVEGYLSCQTAFGKPKGTFSKTDAWYVNHISNWYGLKPGTDEIDDRKAGVKIADVLYLFRDPGDRE